MSEYFLYRFPTLLKEPLKSLAESVRVKFISATSACWLRVNGRFELVFKSAIARLCVMQSLLKKIPSVGSKDPLGKGEGTALQTQAFVCQASVMHKRLFPAVNAFRYRVYYLSLPLHSKNDITHVSTQPLAWLSVCPKDHGPRDGSSLYGWIINILQDVDLEKKVCSVTLLTMPRTLGYAFNPVSFWLCRDQAGQLLAVLCEVNNTFGETHSYLCFHQDQRPITANDWLCAQKCFHVSPFLARSGSYQFKFDVRPEKLRIWIHYFDQSGRRQLITSLSGELSALSPSQVRYMSWRYPFVSLKTMSLILWQALKLWCKRVGFFPKPEQLSPKLSHSRAAESIDVPEKGNICRN